MSYSGCPKQTFGGPPSHPPSLFFLSSLFPFPPLLLLLLLLPFLPPEIFKTQPPAPKKSRRGHVCLKSQGNKTSVTSSLVTLSKLPSLYDPSRMDDESRRRSSSIKDGCAAVHPSRMDEEKGVLANIVQYHQPRHFCRSPGRVYQQGLQAGAHTPYTPPFDRKKRKRPLFAQMCRRTMGGFCPFPLSAVTLGIRTVRHRHTFL